MRQRKTETEINGDKEKWGQETGKDKRERKRKEGGHSFFRTTT